MRKIYVLAVCLMCFLSLMITAAPRNAWADFPDRPVAFVVIDHSGGVNGDVFNLWKQPVKWAYHFPDYKFVDPTSVYSLLQNEKKLDKAIFARAADEGNFDVIVAVRVFSMREDMVHGRFFRYYDYDDGPFVLVEARADLFVYKKDGDKFLKKRVRESDIRDLGNYERPAETIKWALSDLVNTMENRPIIGK